MKTFPRLFSYPRIGNSVSGLALVLSHIGKLLDQCYSENPDKPVMRKHFAKFIQMNILQPSLGQEHGKHVANTNAQLMGEGKIFGQGHHNKYLIQNVLSVFSQGALKLLLGTISTEKATEITPFFIRLRGRNNC